jgi:hypothetical protein
MALDLGNLIDRIKTKDPYSAVVLNKIADAVNNLARNVGNDSNGTIPAPPPLESLNVKAASGTVHVVLTHNAPIQKGIQYFVEHSTDVSFAQPHVVHLGASRGTVLTLPAKNDSGTDTPHYFRAYAQYPGSAATAPIYFGDSTPTAVSVGGSTQLTLLPSTGSGTAAANGQQGGQGLGKFLVRSK